MNQKIKIGLAVLTGFIVGFAITKVVSKSNKTSDTKTSENKAVEEEPLEETETIESSKEDSFPLKLGSKGEKVKRLQIFLMRQMGWIRQPNGEFDLLTKDRTLKYFKQDQVNKELYEKLMLDKMVHDQRKKQA